MRLEEVLPALRAGKKIRQTWDTCYYKRVRHRNPKYTDFEYRYISDDSFCPLGKLDRLLSDDWEIVEESKGGTKPVEVPNE